jgi:FixJ family two-component response regulator
MTPDAPLIVVVDDNAGMGQALWRLLTAAGFRARVFEPTSHRASLEAGAQAFLAKPFDGAAFLDTVAHAVRTDRRER